MVLAIAETLVLLLAEVDLSVGAVALIGGAIAFKLVQQPGPDWPWWAAILAALAVCGAIGALQGALVALLRIPSFVVTLAGFLLFSGILIVILGGADSTVSLNTEVPNQNFIYDMVQGLISPSVGWIVLARGGRGRRRGEWLRAAARRRRGLVAPPVGLTVIRIALRGDRRGRSGDHLLGQPRYSPEARRGTPVGDPDRPRRARRLDARAPADPLRPLHLRDRRQPGSRPPGRRQPAPRSASGRSRCARRPPHSAASCSVPSSTVSTAPTRPTPASSSCTPSPPRLSAGSASSAAGARPSTVCSAASSSAASPTACPCSTWAHCPRR